MIRAHRAALAALFLAIPLAAGAEEIVVSNYGVTTNGMPYAVAMAKGFFKQPGAHESGLPTAGADGATVPPTRAPNLHYGAITPAATVTAFLGGTGAY